jgi:hypothetical protein
VLQSLTGIEILESLYTASVNLLDKFDMDHRRSLPPTKREVKIDFILGDITKEEWADGDLIFMNSTCYDMKLMNALAEKAQLCKAGSFLITFTNRLPSPLWEVLEYKVTAMCIHAYVEK